MSDADGGLLDMLGDRRRELLKIKFTRGLSAAEEKELAKIREAMDVVEEAEAALQTASLGGLVEEMERVADRMWEMVEEAEEISGKDQEATLSEGTGQGAETAETQG